jgi:hypothetical protein
MNKIQQLLREWIKFQQKVSSLKYSKDLAKIRRDDLKKAEQRYALALATHSTDVVEARAELQTFVEREDEVIRFRAGVDQVEKGEKVTPFFFNQIQSKRLQSNVTCLKTDRFPGGTVSRKETMSELESHFQNEFAEPQAISFVDPKWREDLPKIDPDLRDKWRVITERQNATSASRCRLRLFVINVQGGS